MHKINQDIIDKLDQQIYEDLTYLYKSFKQKISLIPILINPNENQIQIDITQQQLRMQIRNILIYEDTIIQKYTQLKGYLNMFKMIFYRFFGRLVQIIQKEKKKFVYKTGNHTVKQYYDSLQLIIMKVAAVKQPDYIEALMSINQKTKKISKIIVHKPQPTKPKQQHIQYNNNYFNIHNNKNIFKITNNNNHILHTNNTIPLAPVVSTKNTIHTPRQIPQIVKIIRKAPPNINPNSLARLFDCLDLQDCYKCYYYTCNQIKDRQDQISEEQYIRNLPISKQIKLYSKKYLNYKNRQSRRLHFNRQRKDYKNKQFMSLGNPQNSDSFRPMRLDLSLNKNKETNQRNQQDYQSDATSPLLQKTIQFQVTQSRFQNYSKTSKMYFYSPKKISFCADSISLGPQSQSLRKPQSSNIFRRKAKNGTHPRKKYLIQNFESSDIMIQGKKINEKIGNNMPIYSDCVLNTNLNSTNNSHQASVSTYKGTNSKIFNSNLFL